MAMFKVLSLLFVICSMVHGAMSVGGNFSFWFDGFVNSPSFDQNVALFGDSKLVNDSSSSIQLTDSVSGSEGGVIYRRPIKLFEGKESNSLSFSTSFSFSMPSEIGDVLAFVMVPSSLDLSLFGKKDNSSSSALEFLLKYAENETVVGFEFGLLKGGNNARILIGSEIRNISFEGDLMINEGGRLSCMVGYDSDAKRMMVRFRKSGSVKLFDPFFSFSVDLAKLWTDGEVLMGISSVNGNSSKAHFLYSWGFEIRPPMWMHSEPLEPKDIEPDVSEMEKEGVRRRECIWRMLGVLVLGAACGALGVMLALNIWTVWCVRRSAMVVPKECPVKSPSVVVVAIEGG